MDLTGSRMRSARSNQAIDAGNVESPQPQLPHYSLDRLVDDFFRSINNFCTFLYIGLSKNLSLSKLVKPIQHGSVKNRVN